MTQDIAIERISAHIVRIAVPLTNLPTVDTVNMYVIQSGQQAVIIDCGSESETIGAQLVDAIQSLGVQTVDGYIATHYHRDHTQGLPYLTSQFPAPVYVHPFDAQRVAHHLEMTQTSITPILSPPRQWKLDDVEVTIDHQPGHTHGHLHITVRPDDAIIVGDHMAGLGTVWIGPPDGHMEDYYSALQHIRESGAKFALPGHGPIITNVEHESINLYHHRMFRERQIYEYVRDKPRTLDDIVRYIYRDRPLEDIFQVAKRTVQAHLAHLSDAGWITQSAKPPDFQTYYRQVEA